jgi:mevalonate kinase
MTFRSNGKLLLTAEYAVLDGAMALAVPTTYGQSLSVITNDSNSLIWKSYDELNQLWFEDEFSLNPINSISAQPNNNITNRLIEILTETQKLNPNFLKSNEGFTVTTHQDFNRLWGLGTSSTLINNIANWAKVNPYALLDKTFGGSGYDIACASHNHPISYQLTSILNPKVTAVSFNPSFKANLYFVYLNEKQNSREGISNYKNLNKIDTQIIEQLNELTLKFIQCVSLTEFKNLITKHESVIAQLIHLDPIKSKLFEDFNGAVKSLGAWGGDFVLVASETNPVTYFKSKGYNTIIPYSEMVL